MDGPEQPIAEEDPGVVASEEQSWAEHYKRIRETDWDTKIAENRAKLAKVDELMVGATNERETELWRQQRKGILGDIESQMELKKIADEDNAQIQGLDEKVN